MNFFFHLNRDEEAEPEFLFLLILVFRIKLSPVIKSDLLLINPVWETWKKCLFTPTLNNFKLAVLTANNTFRFQLLSTTKLVSFFYSCLHFFLISKICVVLLWKSSFHGPTISKNVSLHDVGFSQLYLVIFWPLPLLSQRMPRGRRCKNIWKFFPQMRKKVEACLPFFFNLNRDLQPKALHKFLNNLSHKWKKKLKHAYFFFYLNRDLQLKALQKYLKNLPHKWKNKIKS